MTGTTICLEKYDVSPITGFLPTQPPLKRLPNDYFLPWEIMMDTFNDLLLAGKLREEIHKLPLLDSNRLQTVEEYRRAFLILCMLSHSYVWGKHEETSEVLPAQLAIPWTNVADHLGLCPVVCHAAVVLWNYRMFDENKPVVLSNLGALATYSGSLDEAWFYLVTTEIEYFGAPCLKNIVEAFDNIKSGNTVGLKQNLDNVCNSLEKINNSLTRMYEKCDPYVFYWKIRPYLAGWENMAEAGLPLGLIYDGVDTWSEQTDEYADMSHLDDTERLLRQYRRYAGGSAAQSSLIAAIDVAFGVEHHRTGEKPKVVKSSDLPTDRYTKLPLPKPADELNGGTESPRTPPHFKRTNRNTFLREMRKYMPRPHREFLEALEESANIRSYILLLEEQLVRQEISLEEREIMASYNDCIHQLKLFRDKHVQIVTLYIVNQARKGPNISHGGFSIQKSEEIKNDPQLKSSADIRNPQTHNDLYPQTNLETSPGIRKNSMTNKVAEKFPQLGLARTIDDVSKGVTGTGGTNVMPFLKQSRDETNSMKISLEKKQDDEPKEKSWSNWILGR